MDGSGTPLKPSGHEQHAKLSAKLFELALPPLRRHFACEAETEQSSKKLCIEPGVLLLAACLQQGCDKESEEEKPREADEEGGGTPLKPSGQD